MLSDLRHAFRQFAKSPGFTIVALLTLGVCLASNLTLFAVVDAILLRPLPFPAADRLVVLINSYPGAGYPHGAASITNYFERRHALPAFTSVSLISQDNTIIGDPGSPQRVPIARVTPEFFGTLGVSLALGTSFTDAQLSYGEDRVAILTDDFWRVHFHGATDVLGKTFLNDGVSVVVVGVLPAGFHYTSSKAQFFRPLASALAWRGPQKRHANTGEMVARLAPGITLAEAQAQIDALNASQAADDPMATALRSWGYRTFVRSLHEDQVAKIKPMLLLLQIGAVFLLVIGGVNLANLLLIRASSRARELAIRQALGAGAGRIARDALMENLLLALVGGALGLVMASWSVGLVARFGVNRLPLGAAIFFSPRVAICGLVAALVIGGLLAIPVIWFNLRAEHSPGLPLGSRSGTGSLPTQRLRHAFVVAQIALSFVLLSGAALLGTSLARVLATPAGFNADHLLTGQITMPPQRYPDQIAGLAFAERLVSTIGSLPGVTHAALNNSMPFTGRVSGVPVSIEGRTAETGVTMRAEHRAGVTSDYFATMGIPLLRGRLLDDADSRRASAVCVIDQTMADRYWPDADPIGRRLVFDTSFTEKDAITVVGVVGNVKQNELGETADFGVIYLPQAKFPTNFFHLVVRTASAPSAIAPSIRKAILQLDPELPIDDLRSLQTRIDDSLVARRSPALLAGIFAVVALLLAAIGLYGVMAYAAAQRTREFGIRLALGAQPGAVLRLVLGQGARLAALGLSTGLALTLLLGDALSSLLFGISPCDPLAFAAVAALLASISLVACFLPARRATKVDPLIALRAE